MIELIIICLSLLACLLYLYFRYRDIVVASYYSGYRACAKEAVVCLKNFENEEMKKAPVGELCGAVVRAEAIHQCGMIVRDLTYRIGRPL